MDDRENEHEHKDKDGRGKNEDRDERRRMTTETGEMKGNSRWQKSEDNRQQPKQY
jgi:major membrane immunogen (membrane-anchored lipoprotein)